MTIAIFGNAMKSETLHEVRHLLDFMKEKGINKKELAALTHRRPSDVTRWLSGTHNFTCRTIALIEQALGVHIVEIVK